MERRERGAWGLRCKATYRKKRTTNAEIRKLVCFVFVLLGCILVQCFFQMHEFESTYRFNVSHFSLLRSSSTQTFTEDSFQVMTPVDSKACPKAGRKMLSLDRSLKDWTGCEGGSPSYVQSSVVSVVFVPFPFFRARCPLSVASIFVVFLRYFFAISSFP